MRLLIDENMGSRRLATRLQAAGHEAILATEAGLGSMADARVLSWAAAHDRPVLTRDHEDFAALHDLVMTTGGHHPGILVVRFDNDPRHNLTEREIVSAIGKLSTSGIPVPNGIHVLNHWR